MSPDGPGSESRASAHGLTPPPRLNRMEVRAGVRPTEDGERIRTALDELFPGLSWESGDGALVGTGTDAAGFRTGVKTALIADTVASHLETVGPPAAYAVEEADEGESPASPAEDGPWTATVHLNKQAAMVGRLHLGDCRSALGDVEVTLEFTARPSRESLVRWFVDAPDVPGSGGGR